MSTSLLYHGFGVKHYRYLRTEYRHGALYFHIEKARDKQRCAVCGSRRVIQKGRVVRELKTLPIGKKKVFLVVHLHRLLCQECESLRLEPLLLSHPKARWTRALGRFVLELLKMATIEDVSKYLGMSWNTVKDIHARALREKIKRRQIKHLRYLGIDEIAVRKGHRYLTIVVDLESGQVVWVAEGRGRESLEPFIRRLKRARVPIKAIAMDMWPAYWHTVAKYFSYDVIVFDHYHIISDYNRMLDHLRRQEAAHASRVEKTAYRGVRYLLLKGSEKIPDASCARRKLDDLLHLNQTLNMAYILKEELRELWNCVDRNQAEIHLENWLQKAWGCGIKLVMKFANKLACHRYGILNFFTHRITTGKVEGINNKIKVLKRKAYGFRDMEYFKLRIYSLNDARYALLG